VDNFKNPVINIEIKRGQINAKFPSNFEVLIIITSLSFQGQP